MSLGNLFSKLFKKEGYRWSLYISRGENELVYAMHEDAVLRMVGYVMKYFKNNSKPIEPWKLYLNFNKIDSFFELKPKHFTQSGEDVTPELIQKIQSIDPNYKVKGSKPVFMDVRTNERIKIRHKLSLEEKLNNFEKYKEKKENTPTFFSIMDKVFGKDKNT